MFQGRMRNRAFRLLLTVCTFGCSVCHYVPVAVADSLTTGTTTGTMPADNTTSPSNATAGVLSPFKVQEVATGLEVVWSIAFLPDKRVLLTERPGRLRVIENGKLTDQAVSGLEDVVSEGEIGLMSVCAHPRFSDNSLIYLSYGVMENGEMTVVVNRYKLTGNALSERKKIIGSIPARRLHAGCRVRFGPDSKLYITTGDAGRKDQAQQLDSLLGKTLRLNDDGSIPNDNPFVGKDGARGEIWSYGHRNAQGMDWTEEVLLVMTEHGPSMHDGPPGGDEVNIVAAGKNYGWPAIHHKDTREGMEAPIIEFTPSQPPGSAEVYSGDMFPEYKGHLFFGSLRGECLVRVKLDGAKAIGHEFLFRNEYGRIREVVEAPDGSIWITTSNRDGYGKGREGDDRVLRLHK